jgi:hypothetical protein
VIRFVQRRSKQVDCVQSDQGVHVLQVFEPFLLLVLEDTVVTSIKLEILNLCRPWTSVMTSR